MSPRKKVTRKELNIEASGSGIQQDDEIDTPRDIYDNTMGFLEKGGSLKLGDIFQIFTNKNFLIDVEDQYELKVCRNIIKSRICKVASHVALFLNENSISWILKHVYLENMYICNIEGDLVASFQLANLEKIYHLDK
jgi:hypothetical protein